jgi:hypothetical protein
MENLPVPDPTQEEPPKPTKSKKAMKKEQKKERWEKVKDERKKALKVPLSHLITPLSGETKAKETRKCPKA